ARRGWRRNEIAAVFLPLLPDVPIACGSPALAAIRPRWPRWRWRRFPEPEASLSRSSALAGLFDSRAAPASADSGPWQAAEGPFGSALGQPAGHQGRAAARAPSSAAVFRADYRQCGGSYPAVGVCASPRALIPAWHTHAGKPE